MTRRLPPGCAFAAYLLGFGAWLALMGATVWATLWLALGSILVVAQSRFVEKPSHARLVVVCVVLALAMNVTFQAMRYAVPAVRAWRADALLLRLDQDLFGATPAQWLSVRSWRSEVLSAAYIFFVPLLAINLVRYIFWQRERLESFYRGLFFLYAVGFTGYACVPAAGPYIAYPELFGEAITGGVLTQVNAQMVAHGSNGVDVWPSLHVAVTTYILGVAWRNNRREFLVLLAPALLLGASIFYLRYHYAVDLIAGLALAAAALLRTSTQPLTEPARARRTAY